MNPSCRSACAFAPPLVAVLLFAAGAEVTAQSAAAGMRIPTRDKPKLKEGALRILVCRGAPGLHLVREADPSPRGERLVALSLRYQRATRPAGEDYQQLEPGTCTWNPANDATTPPEPGVVHFDVSRHGSAGDPEYRTLRRWLAEPKHFWRFYVDDVSNLAISHGAYGTRFWVGSELREKSATANAGLTRRVQLRCRGGSGLAFARAGSAGTNLVAMTLKYRAAGSAAGPTGAGLAPGTCAWAEREGLKAEPGRVAFVTAGNAQLKQIQSGSVVDRSTTAAERWPDAQTIPVYLANPAHYWSFTVRLSNADSALRHAAWKPSVEEVALTTPPTTGTVPTTTTQAPTAPPATEPLPTGGAGGSAPPSSTTAGGIIGEYTPGSGTTLSRPGGSSVAGDYSPGTSTTVTDPRIAFDIRNVQVSTGLEGAVIRFEAGPEIAPSVLVSTAAPVGESGTWRFDGPMVRLTVQGAPGDGGRWRYVAASPTPLARGTQYWFLVDAPEGRMSRQNQETGQFRTLAQRVKLGISDIQVLSDGDRESAGDLWFRVVSCPRVLEADVVGEMKQPVQWSEGRHRVGREVTSDPAVSAPDRFRIFITGVDDDDWLLAPYGSSHPFWVWYHCSDGRADLEPREASKAEWNAAVIDLDLTQYAGATSTQTFVRRSQPLRNGSKLSFEVHGYVQVVRE